jgi:hypothetical protein
MTNKIKLWIDDERHAPPGWLCIKTAPLAIAFIRDCTTSGDLTNIEAISFDHDLGSPECGTGYEVAAWLEEVVYTEPRIVYVPQMTIHSANPVGRVRLDYAIKSMQHAVQQRTGGFL